MPPCSWYADELPDRSDELPVLSFVLGPYGCPAAPCADGLCTPESGRATPKSRQPTPGCRGKQPVPIPPWRCPTANVPLQHSTANTQVEWSKNDRLQCMETMSMVPCMASFTSHGVHNDADVVHADPGRRRPPSNFQNHSQRGFETGNASSMLRLPPGKHLLRHGRCRSLMRSNIDCHKPKTRTLKPGRHLIRGGKIISRKHRPWLQRLYLLQRFQKAKQKMWTPFTGLVCFLPNTVPAHTLGAWQVVELDSDAHKHHK